MMVGGGGGRVGGSRGGGQGDGRGGAAQLVVGPGGVGYFRPLALALLAGLDHREGQDARLRGQLHQQGEVVELVVGLVEKFLDYQPPGPRAARIADVRRHLDQTHLCWIGGTSLGDTFYYRIQSPVIMIEFDHHSGVFLANKEPAKCHIHTIVRAPNGNDYGKDLLRQHYEQHRH